MRTIVLARKGTTERAVMSLKNDDEDALKACEMLSKKHGGDWVLADTVKEGEYMTYKEVAPYGDVRTREQYCGERIFVIELMEVSALSKPEAGNTPHNLGSDLVAVLGKRWNDL